MKYRSIPCQVKLSQTTSGYTSVRGPPDTAVQTAPGDPEGCRISSGPPGGAPLTR